MQRRGNICLDAKERVSNCNAEHEVDQKIDLIIPEYQGRWEEMKEWREILKMRGREVERVEEDEGERGRILFGASECPCLGLRPPEGGR